MKPIEFNIEKTNGLARVGEIETPHGKIKTPAFIAAATKATVKTLTNDEVEKLGTESILVNTYHLLLQPGTELIEKAGGINKFTGWSRPTFSDSGGFQIMSLPGTKISEEKVKFKNILNGAILEMTPESSMQAQHKIGTDIHMAFDCPVGYGDTDTSRKSVEKSLKTTHDWAERCIDEHEKLNKIHEKNNEPLQALFGVVQGGGFEDLREESAKFFAVKPFDGYGIGGMYSAEEGEKFLPIINKILPESRPRHWLGMGAEPRDFFTGVKNGIDTFDCVAPTRQARNGALYTRQGRINITNAKHTEDFSPIDENCNCYTCKNHTKAYLRHLFKADEVLALVLATIHNEYFMINLVKEIRESILNDNFNEFSKKWLEEYYGKA